MHGFLAEPHPAERAEVEALRREVERLEALASREHGLLEAILHHSPHGVIVCDAAGRLTLHNRAAEAIWGGSASAVDVAGWTAYRAFHRDGRPYAIGDWGMARCLASGAVVAAEKVEIQRFDGTRGVLLGSCAPIRGPDGSLQGALSVFADITALQAAIVAEREAQQRIAGLRAVTTALCEAALPTEVARVVAVEMCALLGADRAVMAIPSEDRSSLVLVSQAGLLPDTPTTIPVNLDSPLGVAFRSGAPLYVGSREEAARRSLRSPTGVQLSEAIAAIPIVVHGGWVGVIGFGYSRPREFDALERALLDDLARHTGLALERARLYEAERRARAEADAAKAEAELLFRLAEATASATDLAALHELALSSVITLMRVDRAAILLFDRDGVMRFEAWRGLSEAYRRAVEGHTPWSADATEAQPILIADAAADPRTAGLGAVLAAEGIAALGFVPLLHRGRLLGKFMVYCDRPRAFSRRDEQLAATIAAHIAQAVERARLLAAERAARGRAAFLLEASVILASSLDYRETLEQLARLAVPRLADWCEVEITAAVPGRPEPEILCHVDPGRLAEVRALRALGGPGAWPGAARVQRQGEAQRVAHAEPPEGTAPEVQRLLVALAPKASVSAPMTARGRVFGSLTFVVAGSGRRFEAADLELAELLGRRAGIAVDNARLFAAEAAARAEAERLAAEAQAASRAREEVLAVVSHDLRSPLNAIVLGAGTLLRLELDDERKASRVRKTGEIIQRSAERMTRMIGDLIDFASIQAGHLSIERSPVSPREIVEATVEVFGPSAHERELWLEGAVEEGLPCVDCDRDRVIQTLSNLLANAVKVTASGGRIAVRARRVGEEVVFAVADTGPGIPADELPQLFERYWRGRNARYHGTGLGLAIARGLVELHGGRIWAESAVGVGSTFQFALPARREG